MTVIYLIRHGQASSDKENYDELSELGVQQARRLGQILSQRLPAFDVVIRGDMYRHQQTTDHCLSSFQSEFSPIVNAGWNEYDHQELLRVYRPEYSSVRSMSAYIRQQPNPKQFFEQEFNAAVERWISGEHVSDYTETWLEFSTRVHGAFESAIENHADKNSVAVFTSGGPISLLTQALLGVPAESIMRMNWTLMNCGVTKIVVTPTRQFVASTNEHTHFEGRDNKHLITYS